MTNIVWTGRSGSWGSAANWGGGVPTLDDTVQIDTAGITVKIGNGVAAQAYSLSTSGATLSLAGGTLYTVASALFQGQFIESSGVYTAGGSGAVFDSTLTLTGGTIDVVAGAALTINGGGTLAGTLAGAGVLNINGGTTYINAGFSSGLNSVTVSALLGFNENFVTRANFTVLNNGSVDLFGHKLTLASSAVINGVVGNGTLLDAGTLTLGAPNGTAVLDNGLTLSVTGTVVQSGTIYQGESDAGARTVIGKTGQYDINGNWGIYDPSSIGTIINAGIFAKTGGGKTSQINTNFTTSGTIKAATGTLLLNGLVNSISGVVSGSGTLGIAGGQTTFGSKLSLTMGALEQQSGVLVLNKALAFGGIWDMTGGVLNLNSTATTLSLSGHADFDGGTVTGYGGTVLLSGQTQMGNVVIGGPTTLTISGVLDQTGTISFGPASNPVANILAGATWNIEGDSSITGAYGLIDNAGSFVDPNGSATAQVSSEFESTGTISIKGSTLQFLGPTSLAGTITGGGVLDLAGTTTLQAGLGISVAALDINNAKVFLGGNLAYANSFSETGNATLDLGGNTLALSGSVSLDGGYATDGGMLSAAGALTVANYNVQGGTVLAVGGSGEQTGQLNLSGGTLSIGAGATYTLDDDISIYGTGTVSIAGDLVASGTGASVIQPFVTQTGTLAVNDQTLYLQSGGTLGGSITGSGTLNLSGGTYTLQSGFAASVTALAFQSNATASLSSNETYAGFFSGSGTIGLGSDTLSLTGTTLLNGATLSGPGFLTASGDTTLSSVNVINGATLETTGTVEQGPGSTYVFGGTLMIAASSVYTLDASQSIFGGGVLDVAGTLTANGNANGALNVAITDTGTINANFGTLFIGGDVLGSGTLSIGGAGALLFSNTSTITSATTVNFNGSQGHLIIGDMPGFGAVLSDFATGDVIEMTGISPGSVTGTLLAGDKQYLVTDSNHDSIVLSFSTAQNPANLYVGVANDGNAAVFHK